MGHVGQEIALCLICASGHIQSVFQSLVHLFFLGSVGKNCYIFFLTVKFCVIYGYKKPAVFACLCMYIFSFILFVLSGTYFRELFENPHCVRACCQLI